VPRPVDTPLPWRLVLDADYIKDDHRRMGDDAMREVRKLLEERIVRAPLEYGEPAHGPLKGLRKGKFGKLRVLYAVDEASRTVLFVSAAWRKTAYDDLARLGNRYAAALRDLAEQTGDSRLLDRARKVEASVGAAGKRKKG
jgi:mRNA-degrading endonuclease RelE of RelBE toxin-antitoxin system